LNIIPFELYINLKYCSIYIIYKLENLEGCTKIIKGDFTADNNKLLSLNDIEFRGNINILNNPFFDLKDILLNYKAVETHSDLLLLIKYLDEYEVIRGNRINLSKLKDVLYIIDREDFPIELISKYKKMLSNQFRKIDYYDVVD